MDPEGTRAELLVELKQNHLDSFCWTEQQNPETKIFYILQLFQLQAFFSF